MAISGVGQSYYQNDVAITKSTKNINSTEEAGSVDSVSTKDMTMEEYKAYIYDEISKLPVSASQMSTSFSIHISEKGFEAMKNDPDYEKWVLNKLKDDFAVNDPWSSRCGGSYTVHYFGATKEEYQGIGWYEGYNNGNGQKEFDSKSKNSFYVKKSKTQDLNGIWEEKLLERERQQELRDKEYFQHKRLTEYWNKRQSAAASYESNVLTEPVESGGFDSVIAGTIV